MAGVTRATVSYVLTGRASSLKITPEVITRVEKAAKKLRYLPNLAARSLAAGQSRQIGLLIPGPDFIRNYYWGPILTGVEKAALKLDYDILLLSSQDGSLEKTKNYLLQNRIDIAIAIGASKLIVGKRFPVPPVLVGSKSTGAKLPCVYTEVRSAIREVVETMIRSGVNEVVWVGPVEPETQPSSSSDRIEWLQAHCKDLALPLTVWKLNRPEGGGKGRSTTEEIDFWASQIVDSGHTPKAGMGFVCWNDLLALGLYQRLSAAQLVPGRDVAVVGFDNHFAEAALPPLASIGFNAEKLGEAAVEMALSVLEARKNGKRLRKMPAAEVSARLLLRESMKLSL